MSFICPRCLGREFSIELEVWQSWIVGQDGSLLYHASTGDVHSDDLPEDQTLYACERCWHSSPIYCDTIHQVIRELYCVVEVVDGRPFLVYLEYRYPIAQLSDYQMVIELDDEPVRVLDPVQLVTFIVKRHQPHGMPEDYSGFFAGYADEDEEGAADA